MLITPDYLKAMADTSSYVLDKSDGKAYPLRALFLKQRLGDGQDAYERNADLFEKTIFDFNEALEQVVQDARQLIPDSIINQFDHLEDESAKKIRQQETERTVGSSAEINSEEKYSLFKEESIVRCGKLLFRDPQQSRVLLIANAGFGKTTLLQRIALALSDSNSEQLEEDKSFLKTIEEDSLGSLIPCVITLRNVLERSLANVEEMIVDSVCEVVHKKEKNVVSWLKTLQNDQLVLLIDGLDELPSESVMTFLNGLKDYLQHHSRIRVILTTRVSGIDDDDVQKILSEMRFHGRAILPLSEKEALLLCEKWISQTGNDSRVLNNFKRIQSETHLAYLREFTRNPLELVMLIKYLPSQSMVLNRWSLFFNVLRTKITNHVELNEKDSVFKDECTLLSFIAFQMQLRNRLYLTSEEVETLIPTIEKLEFYTNLFETSPKEPSVTLDHVWAHLKKIARDVDVIAIEGIQSLSMPIRAYQEFFAANATCALCIDEKEPYPNPYKLLSPYFGDPSWLGVLAFVVARMQRLDPEECDSFISALYKSNISIASLFNFIDNDYSNSLAVAKVLCESKLKKIVLGKEEKYLIQRCMESKSASNYREALVSLYEDSIRTRHNQLYLEAVAYASLFDAIKRQQDPIWVAVDLLKSKQEHENAIGAEMLVLLSRIILEEEPFEKEYFSSCQWEIPKETYPLLYKLSIETNTFVFVSALTELYVSLLGAAKTIHPYLDNLLLNVAFDELNCCLSKFDHSFIPLLRYSETETASHIKEVLNTIGLFPYEVGVPSHAKELSETTLRLIHIFYEEPIREKDLNLIVLAISEYHLTGSIETLQKHWVEDVCLAFDVFDGFSITNDRHAKRGLNHYDLIEESFKDMKKNYYDRFLDIDYYSYKNKKN